MPVHPTLARPRKRPRALVLVGIPVGLVVCAIAGRALYSQLAGLTLAELQGAWAAMPVRQLCAAALLVVGSYAWLTLYDRLGLAASGRRPRGSQIASTSFIAYAVSKTFGFPAFTSGFIRLRRYRHAGFTIPDLARFIVMTGTTLWLGFAVVIGALLLVAPSELLPLSIETQRWGGACLVALALGWVALATRSLPALSFRAFSFRIPSARVAVAQLAVGAGDWVLLSAVLWMLLPAGPGLVEVVLAVGAAQVVAVASRVPGGAGVLEATLLLLLRDSVDTAALAASVLAFRVLYYLAPLGLAGIFVLAELALQRLRGVPSGSSGGAPLPPQRHTTSRAAWGALHARLRTHAHVIARARGRHDLRRRAPCPWTSERASAPTPTSALTDVAAIRGGLRRYGAELLVSGSSGGAPSPSQRHTTSFVSTTKPRSSVA